MATTARADEAAHRQALEARTACEAFQITTRVRADGPALRSRDGTDLTWREYGERVRSIAAGLDAIGLGRGDTMGTMLRNRPEFHLVDTAAMHLGATPYGIYNTYTADQIAYLVGDAQTRVIVTEQVFLPILREVRQRCSALEHVVVVDGEGEDAVSLAELEGRGRPDFDFEAAWRAVEPDDILTLIYTSGTTGPPKGVQLTHRNLAEIGRALDQVNPMPPEGGRIVSYLPMAHIAERAVSHYIPMLAGHTVTTCEDPKAVIGYLPEVRPTWFFAVPRIWEKLKAGLEAMIDGEQDENRKKAMEWAFDVCTQRVRAEQEGRELPGDLAEQAANADRHVMSRLREKLGFDQLEVCIVGAAPTPREVLEFFHAMGVPIAEVWGMSETTGAATLNPPDRIKIGTVGTPLPGTEIKLAEDGELLVRGPGIMVGYRNMPDKTAETVGEDGWLHTGDIGEIDDEGYLRIVDRKKELIINAAGKNMSPANIEAVVKASSPLIGQCAVIGDGRSYNTALIVLDSDFAPAWAAQQGIEDTSLEALAGSERMREAVEKGVAEANGKLARVEQVKRFAIVRGDWAPGGDELTPTMKLKRKPIAEKYAEEIEALYSG
jgi:long-chain acyl-CoA synthetase